MRTYRWMVLLSLILAAATAYLWFGDLKLLDIDETDPQIVTLKSDLQKWSAIAGVFCAGMSILNAFHFMSTWYETLPHNKFLQFLWGLITPYAFLAYGLIVIYAQAFAAEQKFSDHWNTIAIIVVTILVIFNIAAFVTGVLKRSDDVTPKKV